MKFPANTDAVLSKITEMAKFVPKAFGNTYHLLDIIDDINYYDA